MGHRPVHFQLCKIMPDVFSTMIVPPHPTVPPLTVPISAPPTVSTLPPDSAPHATWPLAHFLWSFSFFRTPCLNGVSSVP